MDDIIMKRSLMTDTVYTNLLVKKFMEDNLYKDSYILSILYDRILYDFLKIKTTYFKNEQKKDMFNDTDMKIFAKFFIKIECDYLLKKVYFYPKNSDISVYIEQLLF
jgi:hypothetical protein